MDLKAHIQAARRAPLSGAPMQPFEFDAFEIEAFEIEGGGLADGRRPSLGLPESPALAILASVAALTLLWLAI